MERYARRFLHTPAPEFLSPVPCLCLHPHVPFPSSGDLEKGKEAQVTVSVIRVVGGRGRLVCVSNQGGCENRSACCGGEVRAPARVLPGKLETGHLVIAPCLPVIALVRYAVHVRCCPGRAGSPSLRPRGEAETRYHLTPGRRSTPWLVISSSICRKNR